MGETLDTVLRQIGFSWFEQQLHGKSRHLSTKEVNDLWVESVQCFYGADGEVFSYHDIDRLWSTINHLHTPFYVYAYAFGALLTQSLFAARDDMGKGFEPLYINLLQSGGTKNVRELLQPFSLDPGSATFWDKGVQIGLERLIEEAESIAG